MLEWTLRNIELNREKFQDFRVISVGVEKMDNIRIYNLKAVGCRHHLFSERRFRRNVTLKKWFWVQIRKYIIFLSFISLNLTVSFPCQKKNKNWFKPLSNQCQVLSNIVRWCQMLSDVTNTVCINYFCFWRQFVLFSDILFFFWWFCFFSEGVLFDFLTILF